MIRWLVLASCIALAACGVSRPSPFIVPSPFQIGQPFEGAERNDALIRSITETTSIVIEPIEGLSGPFNETLMAEVARAAQENDIPLSVDFEAQSADRLRGQFELRTGPRGEPEGRIVWRLETARGALVDAFEAAAPLRIASAQNGEAFDTDNAAWRSAIAEATAIALGRALDARPLTARRLEGIETGAPAATGPPVLVPAIMGAPGDGERSLTRAVRELLRQQDVNVIDPAAPPQGLDRGTAYTLQGSVDMGEPDPDRGQPIAISWDLYDPAGRHLGNVAQQNVVDPGSLDGPWGEVAIYAAMGAVEGIMTLLALIPEAEG